MRFFSKARKKNGKLVFTFLADGICAASVERRTDAKPVVQIATFQPVAPSFSPDALDKLARELKAPGYHCMTLLGDGEYQILTVEAPNVAPDELKTAVRWRLKDMLDFHIDDATIDVLDMPTEKGAAPRAHSMFAIAARNTLIQSRQALFDEAKVELSVIDIPEMAQRNISALLETPGRGLAMLSFGHQGGLLTISYNGELYLARHIDVTLEQLHDADSTRRNGHFDRIALELQRSLDHFDRQFHFISVARMVLAPTGSNGLQEFLAQNIYVPVEPLSLGEVFDLSEAPHLQDTREQIRYLLTLGAALRHEEVVL